MAKFREKHKTQKKASLFFTTKMLNDIDKNVKKESSSESVRTATSGISRTISEVREKNISTNH